MQTWRIRIKRQFCQSDHTNIDCLVTTIGICAELIVPISPGLFSSHKSESVQIGNHVAQFVLIKLISEWRHHVPAMHDALHHVLVCCGKSTGQVGFPVQLLQAWTFVPTGGISGMAIDAINIEDFASLRLLWVQSQFGIGHLGGIFTAAGQQSGHWHHQKNEKNGRYSAQVTIMSVAWRF